MGKTPDGKPHVPFTWRQPSVRNHKNPAGSPQGTHGGCGKQAGTTLALLLALPSLIVWAVAHYVG